MVDTPRLLSWPFPHGGGVWEQAPGITLSVAVALGGRHASFLGEQDTDGVVELYSSVPLDARSPPRKWNAPLVLGGDADAFALRPSPGAVLYRADQDQARIATARRSTHAMPRAFTPAAAR